MQFFGNSSFQPMLQNNMMGQRSYPQYPQNYPQVLKGKLVTCEDEVKSSQIDLDGTISYFPCTANGLIYTKSLDLNGMPIIKVYKELEPPKPKQFAEVDLVNDLAKRIENIEQFLTASASDGGNKNG